MFAFVVTQVALEELHDLKEVWSELSKVWEQIDQMKEQPWVSVQPRKVPTPPQIQISWLNYEILFISLFMVFCFCF